MSQSVYDEWAEKEEAAISRRLLSHHEKARKVRKTRPKPPQTERKSTPRLPSTTKAYFLFRPLFRIAPPLHPLFKSPPLYVIVTRRKRTVRAPPHLARLLARARPRRWLREEGGRWRPPRCGKGWLGSDSSPWRTRPSPQHSVSDARVFPSQACLCGVGSSRAWCTNFYGIREEGREGEV